MAHPDFTNPDSVPVIYTNAMSAQGGAFDVGIDFGYRAGEGPGKPEVRVVMSWEHAAVMVKLLQRMIDDYARDVGDVRDLERLLQQGEAAAKGGDAQ